MRPLVCALLVGLLGGAVSLEAAPSPLGVLAAPDGTVTAIWDPNPPSEGLPVSYRLYFSLMPGLDETAARIDTTSTSVAVPGLLAGRTYYFHVRAISASGLIGDASPEVVFLVAGVPPVDPCAFPLGSTSVSIFVTGRLQKTGSGAAGSGAAISFRAFSPNSPITYLSIRANGVDIPDSVASASGPGDKLASPGSLWFSVPSGPATYAFSVYARNLAGCSRQQPTGFSITVP